MPLDFAALRSAPRRSLDWIRLRRRNQLIATGSALAVAGLVVGLVVGLGGGSTPVRDAVSTSTSAATTTTAPSPVGPRCPLTDAPAPGVLAVPRRPALLVKIGNEPNGARPQSGLNEADIVFDTPAEGFIMRYVAVFQCENAPTIGPTRSLRWVDWNMVARQFVHPIVAFAGGINPNVDGLAATPWIAGANLLEGGQAAGHRISSRLAPDNLYTSTAALYGLYPSMTSPPRPIFDFGPAMPAASPAASASIDFSFGTDVVWKWDGKSHQWLHTYSGTPDVDAFTGKQVTTTNVVIEVVHYLIGPYCESGCPGGSGDVESQLVGSGSGYVLRGGRSVAVTWHRDTELSKTTFTNAQGAAVELAPGRTWVEIVPDASGGAQITK